MEKLFSQIWPISSFPETQRTCQNLRKNFSQLLATHEKLFFNIIATSHGRAIPPTVQIDEQVEYLT